MESVNVQLLGGFKLVVGEVELTTFATRKSKVLVAYLIFAQRKVVSRDVLAAQFWPELPAAPARKALNTELWRLRAAFNTAGLSSHQYLISSAEGIAFDPPAALHVDVLQLQLAAREIALLNVASVNEILLARLQRISELYHGHLLPDLNDSWCELERQSLRQLYLRLIEFLMAVHMERQHWPLALQFAQRLIDLDSMQEHVHRALMQCYCAIGNRPAAVRQFRQCVDVLHQELGLAPMQETVHLYETLLASASHHLSTPVDNASSNSLALRSAQTGTATRHQLERALANIDSARHCLTRFARSI